MLCLYFLSFIVVDPWAVIDLRGKWLVQQCVLESTQKTYRTGWRRWLRYCSEMHIDPFLISPPIEWFASRRTYSFPIAATLNYMFQLFFIDKLAASTIGVYLAALKYHFNCDNCDTEWFKTFAITKARSALSTMCRQRKAEREVGKLPFSLDLVELYKVKYPPQLYKNRAIYTAMRLAHLLMLRVSEYTITKANHFIRGQDITFCLEDGSYVTSPHVSYPVSTRITGVLIDVRSAKNDKYGAGHRFYFARDTTVGSQCICTVLLDWALIAMPTMTQPFFCYRSMWRLCRKDMAEALKAVAVLAHLDPSRVSPHSLRYGGASALAAANTPSYLIQQLGRWKSLAFLHYIHLSEGLLATAQAVLSDPLAFTVADIQRFHPGCRLH
jgi:integrase